MNNSNENISMLIFSNETYEVCYNIQGIYSNCTKYTRDVQAYNFSRNLIFFYSRFELIFKNSNDYFLNPRMKNIPYK